VLTGSQPAIDVRQLCFAYPHGPLALQEVTFTVQAGESVGLVGPNGAGKTSLFLCLTGVLPVRSGSIHVCGIEVRDRAQRKRLPQRVGIVFQNSDDQLFSSTVLDDVAFGPLNLGLSPDEVRQRVGEALGQVGMAGQEGRTPLHLSGGEKRRVALAGVLAMRPEVLLLDEPSMFLDPRGRRELITLLNALGGTSPQLRVGPGATNPVPGATLRVPGANLERTIMIASHDLEMILLTCRRVLVLDGGKLVADGETRLVLADRALMEAHGLEVPASLRS
jgi:cobalt/nickel transport system ATP-binding protein